MPDYHTKFKKTYYSTGWDDEADVIIDGTYTISQDLFSGQFMCGNKKCDETDGLRSWEVNFGYVEQGEKKNALVKLRLCPDCSYKLNYHQK